jgi:probable HAF family extracellular repeat protein
MSAPPCPRVTHRSHGPLLVTGSALRSAMGGVTRLASRPLAGLALALLVAAPARAGEPTTFTGVGDLPGGSTLSSAAGISADGSVVCGYSNTASGDIAFRWTDPARGGVGLQPLGDLPGGATYSQARGISADGTTIVGDSGGPSGGEAFRWTDPAAGGLGMQGLGDLPGGGFFSIASGASADGHVVTGHSASALSGTLSAEAFRWTDPATGGAGLAALGDIPGSSFFSVGTGLSADGSVVCGYGTSVASGPASSEAARWTAGTGLVGLGDLGGGGFGGNAFGISADGNVIVGISAATAGVLAFRWTNPATGGSGMASLGDLPGGSAFSRANAVSADGSVVVGQSIGPAGMEAFVWSAAEGMRSVKTLLTDAGLDMSGWTLEVATGVSADGRTIVGYGPNPLGSYEGWIAHLGSPWEDLRHALAGSSGAPLLAGIGPLVAGTPVALELSNALASSPVALILGFAPLDAPFKGGVLVPQPDLALTGFSSDGTGTLSLASIWPAGIPSGFSFWAQEWIVDPAGPAGFAASNGLSATTP